eukprot:SM000358S13184  [mRNA]  locus=s358:16288:16923:- [translate_table: standard]
MTAATSNLKSQSADAAATSRPSHPLTGRLSGSLSAARGLATAAQLAFTGARLAQVTFSKRRHGLFKKADQLAILCEADVAVILFSSTGRLFAFANSNTSVAEVLERYHNHSPAPAEQGRSRQDSTDQLKKQLRGAHQQLGSLMASQARLRGEDLGLLALTDLEGE